MHFSQKTSKVINLETIHNKFHNLFYIIFKLNDKVYEEIITI